MKTNKLLLAMLPTVALAVPTSALAGDALPKPNADLHRFVGTWKGGGTLTIGKDTAKVAMTWSCKPISAKSGVGCTLTIKGVPGLPKYEETDLFGYEPNSDTYHWFSVTNAGETHDHATKASDGNKLQFVYTGTQEGKPFKEVIDFEFKDARTLAVRAETFVANLSTSKFDLLAKK